MMSIPIKDLAPPLCPSSAPISPLLHLRTPHTPSLLTMPSPCATPASQVVIDHLAFPHIIDMILDGAPATFLKTMRATSGTYRARVDAMLFRHAVIHKTGEFLYSAIGRLPITWHDDRTQLVAVLDATFPALATAADFTCSKVSPRVLRLGLLGLLDTQRTVGMGMRAHTTVIFIAPQFLMNPVVQKGASMIKVNDILWQPHGDLWFTQWTLAGCVPPSIIEIDGAEDAAAHRIVYNVLVNFEHEAFPLWEIDLWGETSAKEIILLFTHDDSPLSQVHEYPRGIPRYEGRFLNRLLLSIGRHMARGWERGLSVTFVGVEGWNHDWLGSAFVDKEAYVDVDETLPVSASMMERVQFWLDECFESQYLADLTDEIVDEVHCRTRFISLERFQQEAGDSGEDVELIMRP